MHLSEEKINNLYTQALKHVEEHDCSAKPYQSGKKLVEVLEKYKPEEILEIGTGFGLTTALIALTCPNAKVDSLEKDIVHIEYAKKFLAQKNVLSQINLINEAAEYTFESLPNNAYDFILFDGFQIHYQFLPEYERLLRKGGVLFLANNHLQSRTSAKFFEEFKSSPKWNIIDQFDDTTVAIRN